MDCLTLRKSNCKNCYKCIRNCPVKSIKFSSDQANIIGNECIMCGECFVVCPQNAKQIKSSVEAVESLLDSGARVYASLAPSFVANYEGADINSMKAALKKLGFYDAEETAVGAAFVKTEYENILNEGDKDVLISSCCHSVNLLIQKYFPDLLGDLAAVFARIVVFGDEGLFIVLDAQKFFEVTVFAVENDILLATVQRDREKVGDERFF